MKNKNRILHFTLVLLVAASGCTSTKKANDPYEISQKALKKLNYSPKEYHLFLLPGTENVDASVRINEEVQWVELIQPNVAAVRVGQQQLNRPVKILIITRGKSGRISRYEKSALVLEAAPQMVKAFVEEPVR